MSCCFPHYKKKNLPDAESLNKMSGNAEDAAILKVSLMKRSGKLPEILSSRDKRAIMPSTEDTEDIYRRLIDREGYREGYREGCREGYREGYREGCREFKATEKATERATEKVTEKATEKAFIFFFTHISA